MPVSTFRRRASQALAAAILILPVSAAFGADDSDLFVSTVPPNVLIGFDTSVSMSEVMYPPAFDPADSTCSIFTYYAPSSSPWQTSGSGDGNKNDQNGKSIYWKCDSQTRHCRFEISETHANFVQTGTYTCPGGGTKKEGYIQRRLCNNDRRLYVDPRSWCDGQKTWHSEQWAEWYFSDAADPYILWDENNTSTDPNMIDANRNGLDAWDNTRHPAYKRSRMRTALQVAREVIFRTNTDCAAGTGPTCTQYQDRVRFGIGEFGRDKKGGYVSSPIDDYSNNRTALENTLKYMVEDDSTPAAEAVFRWYTYFMSRNTTNLPKGKDNTTKFPVYRYNTSAGDVQSSSTHASVPPQPVTAACEKNFLIYISDGAGNGDNFTGTGAREEGFANFKSKLIGDYYRPGGSADEVEEGCPAPPGPTNCLKGGTRYVDDIAYFMNTNDFAPDLAGDQTLDVYTVAFNVSPTSDGGALLLNAGARGGGTGYFGAQAEELADALTNALTDIIDKSSKSFASASVPASRTSSGDNFYSTYFEPSETDPLWEGHLKAFQISGAGDLLDANGYCLNATVDNDPPPCSATGVLRQDTAPDFWDAADEIPAPASRNLYFGRGDATLYGRPPEWIDTEVTAADLGLVAGDLTPSPNDTASDTDELAVFITNFFRGCEFGTDCTTRVGAILGDIFHSNPVAVGSPSAPINEASYKTFATSKRTRDRVIYAGANDGFLHAFHAGDWQTDDARHDTGTGVELFGFMPSFVQKKAKNLAPNPGVPHNFYGVDGPPAVADAWIYRDFTQSGDPLVPLATMDDKVADQWRSVIVGGYRQGGRGYYALDVTDPASSDYPGYMWEFPCDLDDCASSSNPGTAALDDYTAEGWGEPVITRVRVASDSGTDPRGYERWVAIFGSGYATTGDPNDSSNYDWDPSTANPRGRAIFMVDLTTGELLAWKYFNSTAVSISGTEIGFPEMRYAFVASPAVFDLDFDGFADVIYFGDLGGNLWKWVVSDIGDDPINNSSSDDNIAQPDWPFRLFFRGSASTEPPAHHAATPADPTGTHFQSFFNPPTGVLKNNKLVLAFGAGERAKPTEFEDDGSDANNNHYYVVVDDDPLELTSPAPNPLTGNYDEGDLADNSTLNSISCGSLQSSYQGYYLTGRDAEKFLTKSTVFLGDVIATSFVPSDPSVSACTASGTGYLYRFGIECGDGAFTTHSGDDEQRRKAIGAGLPSRPRVSAGGLNTGGSSGGCESKVTVITSDGSTSNDCPGTPPSSGINLRSWRERQ